MQNSPAASASVLAAVNQLVEGRTSLLCVRHGSHLFGTAGPESDLDIKVVFLPTAEEILLGKCDFAIDGNPESRKMSSGDMDIQAFSLMRFLSMLGRFDPVALECFFASFDPAHVISMDPRFARLQACADALICRDHVSLTSHARANLGRFAPDHIARTRDLSALAEILSQGDPDAPLRNCPNILRKLADQPRCGLALHFRDGNKLTDENVPEEALLDGGARNATLFINLRGRLLDTSMALAEIKRSLQKRSKDDAKRRAGAKRISDVSSKQIYHALRLLSEFAEYHSTGKIRFPRPDRDLLNAIRNNELGEAELISEAAVAFDAVERLDNDRFRARRQNGAEVANAFITAFHREEVKN